MALLQQVLFDLRLDEDFRPSAYQDSEGFWTIGYGCLIDARRGAGITELEAEYLLRNRVIRVFEFLAGQSFWYRCNEARQAVLVNMAYNLGHSGLLGFKKMIAAIEAGDWNEAANQILDSKAARQTGNRYKRLAAAMREG